MRLVIPDWEKAAAVEPLSGLDWVKVCFTSSGFNYMAVKQTYYNWTDLYSVAPGNKKKRQLNFTLQMYFSLTTECFCCCTLERIRDNPL